MPTTGPSRAAIRAESKTTKVFLSYSRKDREAVQRLADALEAREDIEVFRDTEDILPTEEWRQRLGSLIAEADTVVFCLSPDSAVSQVCAWEVEHAAGLNKRIAPVVIRNVDGQVPLALARLNYIFFTDKDPFERAFENLVMALNTDIAWIREHTRLGQLALRWEGSRQSTDLLLRGGEVDAAELWMKYRPNNAPEPAEGTVKFIVESRNEANAQARRNRRAKMLVGGLSVLLVAAGIAWRNQDSIKEQIYWRTKMHPAMLSAAAESALKLRDDFTECRIGCPAMVVVPAGEFLIGSLPGRGEPNEQPQQKVAIRRRFAVGKFEVTFDEWDACTSAGACAIVSDSTMGRGRRPVVNVSWNEAKAYADWLSKMTGQPYRLLSEAEWEYAARAGSTTRYAFADDASGLSEHAWHFNNAGGKTQEVGKKAPNGFGLYDMHGNVWEWVMDTWNTTYAGVPADGSARSDGDRSIHVLRGGSWGDPMTSDLHRVARRNAIASGIRLNNVGFRVARSLLP